MPNFSLVFAAACFTSGFTTRFRSILRTECSKGNAGCLLDAGCFNKLIEVNISGQGLQLVHRATFELTDPLL